jgi:regulatory protein
MGIVTALELNKKEDKARLYVDGSYVLTIPVELVFEYKLKKGMDISESQLEILTEKGEVHRCNEAAYRLLSYRARSEQELIERLARKGFSTRAVERSIEYLKERGLVNDEEFACQWAENRLRFKPQSAFLTRRELKEKGLSEEIIEKAVENYNDYENALAAARPKALKENEVDYLVFKRRIGNFLNRRGFNYGVIKQVINQLWKEVTE